jgi:hypothetical protein
MNTTTSATPYALSLTITGTSGSLAHTSSTTLLVNLAAPTSLTATAASASQNNLSWPASFGATSYHVYRSLVSGGPYNGAACTTATSYTDTGLKPSTTYYYVVSAGYTAGPDAGGESAYSSKASATTLAGTSSSIAYVQGNYATPQSPQRTVNVTFNAAQVRGDLNVVVVGWNDSTATVSAVADSIGNAYTRAVGPTVQSGTASQAIYYAKNIAPAAAGANTVKVTFSVAAAYPDIRILEYSGADPSNPVDVTAANSGNSATSSSGSATTTNATDLIFGANLVQTGTTGPGSGFTRRLLTSPNGDIAEDRTVVARGSYSVTAPVSPSNPWIMQMVAFRSVVGK